jgi:hypothetical protein
MQTVAFNSIGFHAALILNRLRNEVALTSPEKRDVEKQPEERGNETQEDRDKAQRDFIAKRIAEIAAFERRFRRKN